MGKIIVFSFFSQFRCKRSKDSNRENTLKMQWFSGLKFKKYLLFSIFSVYLGGYLETNRLRLYPASSKKGKSIYFLMAMSHLPYLLKKRVYSY